MDEDSFYDAHDHFNPAQSAKPEKWLKDFEDKCLKKLANAKLVPKQAVKIAILDTGIDSAHTCFAGKIGKTKSIRDVVEFECGKLLSQAGDDTEGHGTHTTALLSRLAPMAVIYVARVARTTDFIASADVAAVRTCHSSLVLETYTDVCRLFGTLQKPGTSTLSPCLLAFLV
jgi:hypothetical protein